MSVREEAGRSYPRLIKKNAVKAQSLGIVPTGALLSPGASGGWMR